MIVPEGPTVDWRAVLNYDDLPPHMQTAARGSVARESLQLAAGTYHRHPFARGPVRAELARAPFAVVNHPLPRVRPVPLPAGPRSSGLAPFRLSPHHKTPGAEAFPIRPGEAVRRGPRGWRNPRHRPLSLRWSLDQPEGVGFAFAAAIPALVSTASSLYGKKKAGDAKRDAENEARREAERAKKRAKRARKLDQARAEAEAAGGAAMLRKAGLAAATVAGGLVLLFVLLRR